MIKNLSLKLLVISGILTLSGCGDSDQTPEPQKMPDNAAKTSQQAESLPQTPEERVKTRSGARWEAIMDRDLGQAYGFLSPGMRTLVSKKKYGQSVFASTIQRTHVEVLSVTCEESVCDAKIAIHFVYTGGVSAFAGQQGTSVVKEKWVNSNAEWWFMPSLDSGGVGSGKNTTAARPGSEPG